MPSTVEQHGQIRKIHAKRLNRSFTLSEFQREVEREADPVVPIRGYPVRLREPVDPSRPEEGSREVQRFFIDYATGDGQFYGEILGSSAKTLDLVAIQGLVTDHGGNLEEPLHFDTVESVRTKETNGYLVAFLSTFGPILLLLVLFWFLFMRQMRGQGQSLLSFGRSRAVLYNKENKTGVSFADVAGIEEAKDEVSEIIEFLKNPAKFQKLGGRIPRGVLLVGQPGTGKTLLAKAIAGEAGVPFLSISGSDFVEMFVGVGASRVRDLFKQAKDSAPCIVFLDEIDAVGRKRGSGMGGGHDEREQTLNAILVEMDGFATDEGIIVIAATNRPDVLDPALLRPGRFDREIVIDLPDVKGRAQILGVHTKTVKLHPGVDLESLARGTPGFSGAELAALVNEAAIQAAMRDHETVQQEDFEEARDKVRFGRQKRSRVMDVEDKRITAFHEAGHAVVNALCEHTEPVHKVTIIPRGMALGATMMLPEKDQLHITRKNILDQLAVLYGGRVAEELFCDDITAGASNDIMQATRLVRMMVTEWGMSENIGPINFADRTGSDFLGTELSMGKEFSDQTVRRIDEEVSRVLNESRDRAQTIIESNREAVERVAEALLRFETIHGDEVKSLVDGNLQVEDLRPSKPLPPPPPAEIPPQPAPRPEEKFGTLGLPGEEGLSPA
ncbi:MAG: ATP-dependent zinc metalloprotease FtsH [Planctomycetota bacterium]|nr:MAG: ATP-dependent zinc metalloprotease FtsH [Planctomycetota bacterium]